LGKVLKDYEDGKLKAKKVVKQLELILDWPNS
jgi:hypothetical protein